MFNAFILLTLYFIELIYLSKSKVLYLREVNSSTQLLLNSFAEVVLTKLTFMVATYPFNYSIAIEPFILGDLTLIMQIC